jgi:hypothetical protein
MTEFLNWLRRRSCRLTLGVLVLAFASAHAAPPAVEAIREYFNLLVSGNFESASYMWTESAQERSSRFGIVFDDIPVKADALSPIVRNLPVMRDHLQPPVKRHERLSGEDFVRLQYSAVVEGQLVTHDYYAIGQQDWYWLIYPQDYYCRDWPVMETKYFRIHYHPDQKKMLNPVVLDDADLMLARLAADLGLSSGQLRQIEQSKIEYFYCDSDETVESITGYRVKGTLDVASNDIVSAFFPHYHELCHLLVNIRLQRLSLYTAPLLREGLAVHFGGRWGKAPAVLVELGAFLHQQEIMTPDSLLTMTSFERNATADIAYPVAGLMTGYLIDRVGLEKYLELYRNASGRFDYVHKLSAADMRTLIQNALGLTSWAEVLTGLDRYITDKLTAGSGSAAGQLKGRSIASTAGVAVTGSGEWYGFSVQPENPGAVDVTILFGRDKALDGAYSLLYNEQFGDSVMTEGFRFGVRMDHNEAGLYDYATNHLLAKYILGITPSPEYLDPETGAVAVKFRHALLGKGLFGADKMRIVFH